MEKMHFTTSGSNARDEFLRTVGSKNVAIASAVTIVLLLALIVVRTERQLLVREEIEPLKRQGMDRNNDVWTTRPASEAVISRSHVFPPTKKVDRNLPLTSNAGAMPPATEPINVMIIAMGASEFEKVMTMIKSMLHFYDYKGPLNLILVGDDSLEEFPFEGSECITITKVVPRASLMRTFLERTRFSSRHYSSIPSLHKMVTSDLLPPGVKRVLIIDADIIFMRNVRDLWEEAISLNRPVSAVCLLDAARVERYCLRFKQPQFCHPTHYCHGGLLFFDFDRRNGDMEEESSPAVGTTEWWTDVTTRMVNEGNRVNRTFKVTDQDILNFAAATTPQHIGFIPCEWGCDPVTHRATGLDQNRCPNRVCSLVHFLAKYYNSNSNPNAFYRYFWMGFRNMNEQLVLRKCAAPAPN